MSQLQHLPRLKRAVACCAIAIGLPFVALWRGWVALKWRIWSGRIYLKHHHRHGRR